MAKDQKVTLNFGLSDGRSQPVSFVVPAGKDSAGAKTRWTGAVTEASPKLEWGDLQIRYVPGSSTLRGMVVNTKEGTKDVVGTSRTWYSSHFRQDNLATLSITTAGVSTSSYGVTNNPDIYEMWLSPRDVSDDSILYRAEMFRSGNKIILQVWVE